MKAIYNIASLCAAKKVNKVVMCPGSRCAPLTIAFARHPEIETFVIPDERAAAFVALGMAEASNNTVALICTSGSAVYNFAPAVAEAFFRNIPLLLLTADRPTEWIAQQDGQTIFQQNIFGKHVKQSYQLPEDYSNSDAQWFINRTLNEAINHSNQSPKGPVHVNVPLREPLYSNDEIVFDNAPRVIEIQDTSKNLEINSLITELKQYSKVLIVAGQSPINNHLLDSLFSFTLSSQAVLVADSIANCHSLENVVSHHDIFINAIGEDSLQDLQPDLLITFGGQVLSKGLKNFLRKYKAKAQWHVSEEIVAPDSFQQLTKHIQVSADSFFTQISQAILNNKISFSMDYANQWEELNEDAEDYINRKIKEETSFNEFSVIAKILPKIPTNCHLHLSNSMTVRYVNIIGIKNYIPIYCNRGTSGIDGSTSTALGNALVNNAPNVLITGDLAFFYDRNAFWHNHIPSNLKVIILNNHAGGIFRLIDGPSTQPEIDTYFETNQKLNAKNTASDFGLNYYFANDYESFDVQIAAFLKSDSASILEIETDKLINAAFWEKYKIGKSF
ncbi:MAG: hypothetical protein RLZZ175_1110 [Bacteroidota bacterium]|jgi:2-succinyl-5-enolpyruvyl-6-hydroxy-3-cyclohexene-1-carboxylate synthase